MKNPQCEEAGIDDGTMLRLRDVNKSYHMAQEAVSYTHLDVYKRQIYG